jgi:hypothetical protein
MKKDLLLIQIKNKMINSIEKIKNNYFFKKKLKNLFKSNIHILLYIHQ